MVTFKKPRFLRVFHFTKFFFFSVPKFVLQVGFWCETPKCHFSETFNSIKSQNLLNIWLSECQKRLYHTQQNDCQLFDTILKGPPGPFLRKTIHSISTTLVTSNVCWFGFCVLRALVFFWHICHSLQVFVLRIYSCMFVFHHCPGLFARGTVPETSCAVLKIRDFEPWRCQCQSYTVSGIRRALFL